MGMNDNYKQPLFGSFQRLRDFALDPSTIHENVEALENYISSSGIAYTGQFVFVKQPVPSIYVVDLENFHRDENGKLQKYIRFAGLDDIEELKENTRKLLEKFNENLEAATDAINKQVEDIKQDTLDIVNSCLGDFYTKDEADKLHSDVDNKITEEINKIFNGVDSETIDSLLDIIEYIEQHNGDYILLGKEVENINKRIDELYASLDRDITTKVEELESKVDQKDAEIQSSINSLETDLATKVTADEVKELIGGAKLKNVEQTMILSSFNEIGVFDEGTIFKSITVEFEKAEANESDIFRIKYLDRTETAYILIDTQDIDIVSSSQCSYEYILNKRPDYEKVDGQYKILIETNANPEKLYGKVYITYFLENN